MFGNIVYIGENIAHVENHANTAQVPNLMNTHIILEVDNQRLLEKVGEVNDQLIKISFLGEFVDGHYVSSNIRMINNDELTEDLLIAKDLIANPL